MSVTPEQSGVLVDLLRHMTAGHVSTIVASLREPGSRIGTSASSANYEFLRKLCDFDMAEELPLDVDLPEEVLAGLTSFVIREDAKTEIASLVRTAGLEHERGGGERPDPQERGE